MTATGSLDRDLPRFHLGANPVDAGQVAHEPHLLICGRTGYSKEVPQAGLVVALKDLHPFDIARTHFTDDVGIDTFHLQRDGGRDAKLQMQCHVIFIQNQ